jgi:hypothetical protein
MKVSIDEYPKYSSLLLKKIADEKNLVDNDSEYDLGE